MTATAPAPALAEKFATREEWLVAAVRALDAFFVEVGETLPVVRVSVGWPGGRGRKDSVIGQCWPGAASTDGVGQVFVSPVLDDASRVLDVLAHELVHAVNHANGENGHGKAFGKIARAIGLEGKMTATVASEALKARLDALTGDLGAYPHAALSTAANGEDAPKKQGTRMLKVECAGGSGYVVRMTRKWIEEVGTPSCPCHSEAMEVAI